jgi:hypothetical protein
MSPETAVVETNQAATPTPQLVAAFNTAKEAMSTPAPEAKPEVKTETAEPVRQPYAPPVEAPKKEAAPSLDWSTLSEDERKNGYLRQQDYTKKTQEVAEQRRVQEAEFTARREEFERFAKVLTEQRGGTVPLATDASTDPMTKIQALRDEGNYAEADRLLLQTVSTLAQQQVEPIKKEAEVQRLQATFQNVTQEAMANPLVHHYAKEVAQVFDSNAPVVQEFRQFALSSPERMKAMIPAFTYLLACEQDMKALRANQKTAIEEGIKSGIESRRSAANKVPGRVVESAAQSRETATGKMSLLDSFKFASGSLNQ